MDILVTLVFLRLDESEIQRELFRPCPSLPCQKYSQRLISTAPFQFFRKNCPKLRKCDNNIPIVFLKLFHKAYLEIKNSSAVSIDHRKNEKAERMSIIGTKREKTNKGLLLSDKGPKSQLTGVLVKSKHRKFSLKFTQSK